MWSLWEMGRGEEAGGFFDCYLSRSSLSRQIRPQQQKTFTAQETSAFFLLSSHFQSSFCFYIRPTFLSPLRCIVLSMYFFIRVLKSFYSIVSVFFNFLFFWSFPSVEGPHSDTLSRTRFSVFLRILFGVSSSSSSS